MYLDNIYEDTYSNYYQNCLMVRTSSRKEDNLGSSPSFGVKFVSCFFA
jgi:hypothetical protein